MSEHGRAPVRAAVRALRDSGLCFELGKQGALLRDLLHESATKHLLEASKCDVLVIFGSKLPKIAATNARFLLSRYSEAQRLKRRSMK